MRFATPENKFGNRDFIFTQRKKYPAMPTHQGSSSGGRIRTDDLSGYEPGMLTSALPRVDVVREQSAKAFVGALPLSYIGMLAPMTWIRTT